MLEGYSKTDIAPSWRRFVRYWFLPDTVRRALALACVVGPVLTVINQPEALLALDFNTRLLAKIALTFVVPYAVSSYSSAQALMRGGSR
ncbi:MAG: nitrate/nitrite transporter NrtS [Candidatus Binatia bacterium]